MPSALSRVFANARQTPQVYSHAFLWIATFLLCAMLALPAAGQQAAPGNFTEDQLEAFAAASLRIEELNNKWMPQIAEAQSADESAEMRQQAMSEMTEAVREEGLSVEEYNGIHDAAQADPQIMTTVEELRQDLR